MASINDLPDEVLELIIQPCWESRVVKIEVDKVTKKPYSPINKRPFGFDICQRSRSIVKRCYHFITIEPSCFNRKPRQSFINLKLDTIFLNHNNFKNICHFVEELGPRLELIQSLAIDSQCAALRKRSDDNERIWKGLQETVESMKGLKQLIITVDIEEVYGDCQWWGKEGREELRIYADFADMPSLEEMWRGREGYELGPDDLPRDLEGIWCDTLLADSVMAGETCQDFDEWRIKGKSTGFIMRDKQWAEGDPHEI